MAHGLAVCADGGDIARGKLLLRQQAMHGLSVERCQLLREHFAAVDFVAAGVLQVQQAAAQIIAVGHGKMAERALPARAVKSRQHGIYAVHAGAGHQADIVLGHGADFVGKTAALYSERQLFSGSPIVGLDYNARTAFR